MKRILSLIMVCMLVLPIFASCKKPLPTTSTPSSSQSSQEVSSSSSQKPSSSKESSKPSSSSIKPSSSSQAPSSSSVKPSSSSATSSTTSSSSVDIGGGSQTTEAGFNYEDYREIDSDYNRNLFYYNELKFEVADPTVIYISDTNSTEYGYFYAYGTSDQIGCTGFQAWRSKDMTNWEDMGPVYLPDFNNNWAYTNYWAPEIIYDAQGMNVDGQIYKYFMFYNAERYDAEKDFVGAGREDTQQYLSVLYAKEPNGPFYHPDGIKNSDNKTLSVTEPVFDFSFDNTALNADFRCFNTIDASPFVDDDGTKYMYYSGWGSTREGSKEQCIYGVRMKDWFTPDYSTVNLLTQNKRMTVDGPVVAHEGSAKAWGVNEGPFMIKRNGTYMLTFSVYHYEDVNYQIRLATSTSPLANFTKLDPYNGGTVIRTTFEWDGILTTAGHHSFIEVGDEVYIAYHTFKNRMSIERGRALAIDKVQFVNHDGKEILYTNGPTYGLQALPVEVSGYENVANVNNVSATRVRGDSPELKYLTDGLIQYNNPLDIGEITKDVYFNGSTSNGVAPSITIDFGNEYKNVRAIMLHFTREYSRRLLDGAITKTTITYKSTNGDKQVVVDDWKFDYDKYNYDISGVVYPGGAAILEFAELPVKKIEIEIAGNYNTSTGKYQTFKVSEVMVLSSKNNTTITPVSDTKLKEKYSYVNAEVPESIMRFEGETIGTSVANGVEFYTNYGYDLTNDTTSTKSIKTMGPRDQFSYLKGVSGDLVYLEAYFNVYAPAAYLGDQYPKLGIIAKNAEACTFFYIDAYNNYTNRAVGYTQSKIGGGEWDWGTTEVTANAPLIAYKGEGKYTKLAMARIDNFFYFFVDDMLFFETPEQRGMADDVDAVYGFLCFNTGMEVKDYSYMLDRADIQAKVDEIKAKTPVKKNGATFGSIEDNEHVQSSATWNVDNDHYPDNIHYADRKVTLSTTDGDGNYLYFINENSTTLYAEANFKVTASYNDMWPKFGFMFKDDKQNGILFFADCAVGQEIIATPEQMTGTNYGYVHRFDGADNWPGNVLSPDGLFNPQSATGTKLAVYRQGNIFKFLANDQVIFTTTYSLNGNVYPCIFSFNVGLEVTDYRITSDVNDDKIKELYVSTSGEGGSTSNLIFGDAGDNAKQVGTWVLGPGSGTSTAAGDAYTWATSISGKNVYFETEITAVNPINNDPAPKFGLVIRSATHELFFFIDAINGDTSKNEPAFGANNWVGYAIRSLQGQFNFDNQWVCVPGMLYTNGNSAKVGIWYNNGQIYMVVNGMVVLQASGIEGLGGSNSNYTGSLEAPSVFVGVMGFGLEFSFKNASAKADATALTQLSKDLAITDGDITVNGNITDWTGTKAHCYQTREQVLDTDSESDTYNQMIDGNRGFRVRAFMGEKGVYVAYEAVSNTVVTNNTEEWWQNVNIEAGFVTASGNRTVVRVAANGALSDKNSNCWLYSFKIEKVGDYYKTVLELFVPYSTIGYAGTEDYVVGYFAFDPGAESCTGINTEINGETQQEYRADSDFWFGHTWAHPHAGLYEDATKTYKITANGLVGPMVIVVA